MKDVKKTNSIVLTLKRQSHNRQRPTNCLSLFDHFVGLALKRLRKLTNPS